MIIHNEGDDSSDNDGGKSTKFDFPKQKTHWY